MNAASPLPLNVLRYSIQLNTSTIVEAEGKLFSVEIREISGSYASFVNGRQYGSLKKTIAGAVGTIKSRIAFVLADGAPKVDLNDRDAASALKELDRRKKLGR
jgi:hypothetical protein